MPLPAQQDKSTVSVDGAAKHLIETIRREVSAYATEGYDGGGESTSSTL